MTNRLQRNAGRDEVEVPRAAEYDLVELVKKITPDNLHSEFDFGDPVGKEVW